MTVRRQFVGAVPTSRRFALRPDIVVDNDIVIDTKWKSLNPDDRVVGVEQSDVYQMLAYAHAYDARRVVLLYPWHPGLPAPGIYRRWSIAATSIAFDIATVDIGQPDSIPNALRKIIDGPDSIDDLQVTDGLAIGSDRVAAFD